jgi:hypothetical protein
MKRADYNRYRRDIEDEYKRKLDALDKLWAELGDSSVSGSDGVSSNASGVLSNRKSYVEEAIKSLKNGFTLRDIELWIREKYPTAIIQRAYISTVLSRLTGKVVEIVSPKAGSVPASYRKIESSQKLPKDPLDDDPLEGLR